MLHFNPFLPSHASSRAKRTPHFLSHHFSLFYKSRRIFETHRDSVKKYPGVGQPNRTFGQKNAKFCSKVMVKTGFSCYLHGIKMNHLTKP